MKTKFIISALLVTFLGMANISMAQDGNFDRNHPRRAEVNQRLNNQDRRINRDRRQGYITRNQANRMHRRDHQIRREERRMAYRHDGHITRHEQNRLNRQENHMSRRINRA
jgi:hypothetical protein